MLQHFGLFGLFIVVSLLMHGYANADAQSNTKGRILSAFFGLDESEMIFRATQQICNGNSGRDGMPLVLSREVAADTLDASDFQVVRASGELGDVKCATLQPAIDTGEHRTVLLVGQFGSVADPPVRVEIAGDLLALDGDLNFKGATADVIPLAEGPTLILAQAVAQADWDLGTPANCPSEGLAMIVRATWVGGITQPGGAEIETDQMQLYRVTVRRADGSVVTVPPFAVGDLKDSDNNHDLCLDVAGEPLRVFFPAGFLTDPNEDLNPETSVDVSADQP